MENDKKLLARIGNKSVYDEDEIRTKFNNGKTVTVIGLLYYGYFGEGHNINWIWLKNHGYWDKGGVQYPTETQYTPEDVETILREANIDVQNIIRSKSRDYEVPKSPKIRENQGFYKGLRDMIKILFICHGNLFHESFKASNSKACGDF